MRRIPLSNIATCLVLLGLLACSPGDGSEVDSGASPRIPFADQPLAEGEFALVSTAGDTLRFAVASSHRDLRLARYRRASTGLDSLVAIIDPRSYAPISSFQRVHREDGSLTAEVSYGRGFDGQARLAITTPEGRHETNVRTPPPTLDQAQLPLSLAALDFGADRVVSFNFVAAFDQRAIPARLEIGAPRQIAHRGERVRAYPVHLRVSGLEERYWFAADPPHNLLRIEELTRQITWSRP
jgi:hypothetical protein